MQNSSLEVGQFFHQQRSSLDGRENEMFKSFLKFQIKQIWFCQSGPTVSAAIVTANDAWNDGCI